MASRFKSTTGIGDGLLNVAQPLAREGKVVERLGVIRVGPRRLCQIDFSFRIKFRHYESCSQSAKITPERAEHGAAWKRQGFLAALHSNLDVVENIGALHSAPIDFDKV